MSGMSSHHPSFRSILYTQTVTEIVWNIMWLHVFLMKGGDSVSGHVPEASKVQTSHPNRPFILIYAENVKLLGLPQTQASSGMQPPRGTQSALASRPKQEKENDNNDNSNNNNNMDIKRAEGQPLKVTPYRSPQTIPPAKHRDKHRTNT